MVVATGVQAEALPDILAEFLKKGLLVRYLLSKSKDRSWENFTAEILGMLDVGEREFPLLVHLRAKISYRTPSITHLYGGPVFHSLDMVRPEYQPGKSLLGRIIEGWLDDNEDYGLWAVPRAFAGIVAVRENERLLEQALFEPSLPDFALYTGMVLARLELAGKSRNAVISDPEPTQQELHHLALQFATEMGTLPWGTRKALPESYRA